MRGRCHLNVSAIIKKLPEDATIKIIALRHANNFEKVAVKKFTQFPIELDDVVSESAKKSGNYIIYLTKITIFTDFRRLRIRHIFGAKRNQDAKDDRRFGNHDY